MIKRLGLLASALALAATTATATLAQGTVKIGAIYPLSGNAASAGNSAKAALESDARVLAFEAGRKWGHRVNVISPGPYKSRAAEAIGPIDLMIKYTSLAAPIQEAITAEEVGATAAFLSSPLASGITGSVVYVDKGYSAMGLSVDVPAGM